MNYHPITAAARRYLGVPFAHQGRSIHGLDCMGLLVMIARDLGLQHQGRPLAEYDETDYGHIPDAKRLRAGLMRFFTPVKKIQPGHVGLFMIDNNVQHVGVFSEYSKEQIGLIHAYAPARKVVEHQFDSGWQRKLELALQIAQPL